MSLGKSKPHKSEISFTTSLGISYQCEVFTKLPSWKLTKEGRTFVFSETFSPDIQTGNFWALDGWGKWTGHLVNMQRQRTQFIEVVPNEFRGKSLGNHSWFTLRCDFLCQQGKIPLFDLWKLLRHVKCLSYRKLGLDWCLLIK